MAKNNLLAWLKENDHRIGDPQSGAERKAILDTRSEVARIMGIPDGFLRDIYNPLHLEFTRNDGWTYNPYTQSQDPLLMYNGFINLRMAENNLGKIPIEPRFSIFIFLFKKIEFILFDIFMD
jgi:hypothetical protein